MPKENVDGFDFTKDFTSQEMFELLKDEIYKYCKKRYGPFRIDDDTVNCGFDKDCLDYEVNNKLYAVMKIHVYVRLGSQYRDFVLIVTPFNCYIRKWGDESCLCDEKKNFEITKTFRKIMKEKYGEVYVEAGKVFSQEVREFKTGLEEDLFKHKKKLINMKYEDDVKSFDL